MNSLQIENALLAFGFKETSNGVKTKKFIHKNLDHPFYIKLPSGNTTVNYVDRNPLVIHDSYKEKLVQIAEYFSGIRPDFNKFYHSTSLTSFNKKQHGGAGEIHYGIAISFQDEESLIFLITSLATSDFLELNSPSVLDETFQSALNTAKKTWTEVRIGQGVYRNKLLSLWKGCSVSGIELNDFLIASHIKPWAQSSHFERLDVYNGLLLTPSLDKAFDKGYISFTDEGKIIISNIFSPIAEILGIISSMSIRTELTSKHKEYLSWHRENIYKNA